MAKPKTTKKTSKKGSKGGAKLSKERALRAALDLAATKGWAAISLADIAAECQCSLSELEIVFKTRTDILTAYGDHLDQVVAERVAVDEDGAERDRLFDVMMERFDVLNEDRAAILSIAKTLCTDPKSAMMGLPHLGQSMISMVEAAKIPADGPRGMVTAFGLMGVYLYTLKAWREDESADMSKTMAALDRALGHAESLAGMAARFI